MMACISRRTEIVLPLLKGKLIIAYSVGMKRHFLPALDSAAW